jgi:lysophospholipase L1-like esterase
MAVPFVSYSFSRRARLGWVAVLVALAVGCSSSTSATAPTPPIPAAPVPTLQIACPADQVLQSSTGLPIPVPYPSVTSSGGTPPTQVMCSPASGAVFNTGVTRVACTATDTKSVTASCSFNITVTIPPKIDATKFVAYGDSITAGEVRSEGNSAGVHTLRVDPIKAYPTLLLDELKDRYASQTTAIVVANAGLPGERAVDGANRLPSIIDGGAFRVLLVMEGVNDFPDYRAALTAIASMVDYASRRRGLRVYLATEPPQNPSPVGCPDRLGGNWASVVPYNDGLHSIATSRGIDLVDVYEAFHGDVTTLIDCDGLHPTSAGYRVIADTFFQKIRETMETSPETMASRMPVVRRSR